VYAGGVVVLFIFAIHLTRPEEFKVRGNIKRNSIIGIPLVIGLLAVLLIGMSIIVGIESTRVFTAEEIAIGNVGAILFGQHLISFIFAGLLLFATLIASVQLISKLIIHDPAELEKQEKQEVLE
ncbi:MAG: NADH-quinone oxidoreductase subunit J family protein, partial [Candidatus Hodarchaeales archaeon]